MRRRLIVTYVGLLAIVLAGLSVPLGVALAVRNAQTMFIDRLGDTARFASLAEPALRTGRTSLLDAELQRYEAMFGIVAAIVGRDGRLVVASESTLDVTAPAVRRVIELALSGQRTGYQEIMWPWRDDPLVVAEPIGRGGEIIGAALTVSPTDVLHATTRRSWSLLAGLGMLTLLLGAAAAIPLSRWMLRPVHELDEAAHALAEGRFTEAGLAASGPPELRRLSHSFAGMAGRITTLLQRQRTFVSYASHQLRTPLATLRLCVDNLRPAVRVEGTDDYTMLAEEIERMGRMCDALLSYAVAEVASGELHEVDAAAIADARVAMWSPAAAQAGMGLTRHGDDRALARAAPEALDQALDALLSNAIKFAGAEASVTVWVDSSESGWTDVHVVDNGPGMPPEDLALAAQAFWRRPADQNVEGSGLGITIAEALITASGGRLDLAPATPHGVHARIRLPAVTP